MFAWGCLRLFVQGSGDTGQQAAQPTSQRPSPHPAPPPRLLSSPLLQESIALLLTCKQFDVEGAGEATRKMLPLIVSKDQGEPTRSPRRGTQKGKDPPL